MRLVDSDLSTVELTPSGYQFPAGYDLLSGRHIIPDWLNIKSRVAARGITWQWTFPCLYADEAGYLADWLASIAGGNDAGGRIDFIEPNIAVELVDACGDEATLRFWFAHESCPPGESDDVRFGAGFPVDITLRLDALLVVAGAWREEIAPFPPRTPKGEFGSSPC